MTKTRFGLTRREATLGLLAASLPLGAARGAGYPDHPIKIIVPVSTRRFVNYVAQGLLNCAVSIFS